MRAIALALLLSVTLAVAETPDEGPQSITLTRDQIADFERQVEEIIARRERAAFEAGVKHQQQACASLI